MTFSAAATLAQLKDFQAVTVGYAFRRMFEDADGARRFLVADEVGLGKTLVAKGVIAKVIEKMQDRRRVNIVYVCSNQDIAAQNIKRLQIAELPSVGARLATRLTLLPLQMGSLESGDGLAVNFVSFTPGTSFSPTRRTGRKEERRLIYHMLRRDPKIDAKGLSKALCGRHSYTNWREFLAGLKDGAFDAAIASSFVSAVTQDSALMADLNAMCASANDRRRTETDHERALRLEVTGKLRAVLAKVCLGRLQPDLVVLDEFQRFSELLESPEVNPAAELAHDLFNYSDDLRILLLSATPYRMYSGSEDPEEHYAEFLRMLEFLMPASPELLAALGNDVKAFRTCLLDARRGTESAHLADLKRRIENTLSSVMCRTERVASTAGADSMVQETPLEPRLQATDLREYRALEHLARDMKEQDTIEYWKSSPYLLNFMKDYSFKRSFKEHIKTDRPGIGELLEPCSGRLSASNIERYKQLDHGNARLRVLVEELRAKGLFRLVWVPPSVSYWRSEGAYEGVGSVSKQLVFSAWNVVPDALAALLSFEAEREAMARRAKPIPYARLPERLRPRLVFARKDGRLSGMQSLLLMFPSAYLAKAVDPAQRAPASTDAPLYAEVHTALAARLRESLAKVTRGAPTDGTPDMRWYWVALARLEANHFGDARDWCELQWSEAGHTLAAAEEGKESEQPSHDVHVDSLFELHVSQWIDALEGRIDDLGPVPKDLPEVLADVALCAPGTCALRALRRLWPSSDAIGELRSAAARIAWGLRSQFNAPRIVALLEQLQDDDSYWQQVLQHCREGNLQSVLDEYAHCLVEALGCNPSKSEDARVMADHMYKAMTLRTVLIHPDNVTVTEGLVNIEPLKPALRSHYSVRFDSKSDEEKAGARKDAVKAAFNSPFAPFVLTSTSVGQEGLDFHMWCHSVIHWNLPSTPVDLEQREGRVHRYKGYAVRKNVAITHGTQVLSGLPTQGDVWAELFAVAKQGKLPGSSDLVPYWIFEPGGVKVERRVMALPFSREDVKYRRLRRSLALYRLVFAQPRQDDLLACLESQSGDTGADVSLSKWRIDLSPPMTRSSLEAIPSIATKASEPTGESASASEHLVHVAANLDGSLG